MYTNCKQLLHLDENYFEQNSRYTHIQKAYLNTIFHFFSLICILTFKQLVYCFSWKLFFSPKGKWWYKSHELIKITRLFYGIWSNTTYVLLLLWQTSQFIVSPTRYHDRFKSVNANCWAGGSFLGILVAYKLYPHLSLLKRENTLVVKDHVSSKYLYALSIHNVHIHNVQVAVGWNQIKACFTFSIFMFFTS